MTAIERTSPQTEGGVKYTSVVVERAAERAGPTRGTVVDPIEGFKSFFNPLGSVDEKVREILQAVLPLSVDGEKVDVKTKRRELLYPTYERWCKDQKVVPAAHQDFENVVSILYQYLDEVPLNILHELASKKEFTYNNFSILVLRNALILHHKQTTAFVFGPLVIVGKTKLMENVFPRNFELKFDTVVGKHLDERKFSIIKALFDKLSFHDNFPNEYRSVAVLEITDDWNEKRMRDLFGWRFVETTWRSDFSLIFSALEVPVRIKKDGRLSLYLLFL